MELEEEEEELLGVLLGVTVLGVAAFGVFFPAAAFGVVVLGVLLFLPPSLLLLLASLLPFFLSSAPSFPAKKRVLSTLLHVEPHIQHH